MNQVFYEVIVLPFFLYIFVLSNLTMFGMRCVESRSTHTGGFGGATFMLECSNERE